MTTAVLILALVLVTAIAAWLVMRARAAADAAERRFRALAVRLQAHKQVTEADDADLAEFMVHPARRADDRL